MDVLFQRDNLFQAIQVLQSVAAGRNTLPILSNVLIEAKEEQISMAATNLEVGIQIKVSGTIQEGGAITVPARKLGEIVRELPSAEIHLVSTANDRVEITCERAFHKMIGLPAEEFPAVTTQSDTYYSISAETLCSMIKRTSFAASTEENRYFLNGVYLHAIPEVTKMVATDGRRLASIETAPIESLTEELGVIIPIKAASEILKVFGDSEQIRFALLGNQILFADDTTTLVARLVEGEYPKYDQIIPKDNDIRFILNTDQFLSVTRRVSVLANPKTLSIRLDAQDGLLRVSASTPDFGEAREEMDMEESTGDMQIAFNARFLMEVLQNVDSEHVLLELKDSLSAAILKPEGDEEYLCLIMPMRLE